MGIDIQNIKDTIALDQYLKGLTGEAVQSYEPDENGLIRQEFLDYHVKRGLDRTEDIASDLVSQANSEIAKISDLVSLPRLDMSQLSFVVQKGRKQTRQIVDQLHELDHTQTKNLVEVKEKLDVMKQYTSEMRRTFNQSGQTLNSFGLPSIFYLPTLPTILKSIYGEPEVEEVKEDNFLVKGLKVTGNSIKGAGVGLFDVGKDTVVGLYNTVTDPIGTVESLYHSVTNPIETYKYIEKAIVGSYERDMINGDAESRSHWVSYALGTTVTAVVGTKGAGTITKTGVATTKAGAKKVVESAKHLDLAELFPYTSKFQVATVGDVPHGVVDGRKLLENRLLMAEKLTDSGGGLNGPVKPVSNINEFFDMEFGKTLKSSLSKTKVQYDGQSIYKVSKKTESNYFKKGYGIYLDALHKDHLEVIDKTGKVKYVLNLDGTLNIDKTFKANGRTVKGWR